MRATFIGLFVVLESLLLTGVYLLWGHNVRELLDRQNGETVSAYEATTHTYGHVSELMNDTLLQRPGIVELFHQGVEAQGAQRDLLRGRLLQALHADYQRMARYSLEQLHFHDRTGHSFLRFHRPALFGDDQLAARPSVRLALQEGRAVHGFEIGKLLHGYRYVYPVRVGDQVIGSLETSINFQAIDRALREVSPGQQFSLWLRRDRIVQRLQAAAALFPVGLNDDYVIEDLEASLSHRVLSRQSQLQSDIEARVSERRGRIRESMAAGEQFALPVRLEGLNFAAIGFMPIRDTEDILTAYLVSYMPLPEVRLFTLHYLMLAAVATLLLGALVLFARRQRSSKRTLENERRMLRSITDNMLEGLFVQNAAGRLVYWNPALERILGYTPAQLCDCQAHELIHAHGEDGRHTPMEQCPIRNATLRGDTYYSEQESFRTAAGQAMPVEVTCAPVWVDGRVVGSITVFRDASQRLQMQKALEDARGVAEHSARMKSSFLANMSHEIRTPMNGLIGMLALALETPLNAEQREYLEIAQNSGDMLLALLNDILDVSKVDAGLLVVEQVAFDLVEVVEHTAKLIAARAHQKQLELILDIEPGLPRHVLGDPLRIRQVLTNLLSNAVKFTERGEIVLAVQRMPGQGDTLRFSVRDTGVGIAPAAQQYIFEAFRQADESTTRKYGGTGLGLALSRNLVRLMGGRIELTSHLGEGSCFYFDLGLPAQDGPAGTPRPGEQAAERLAGIGVLVVDERLTSRQVLERQLAAWGMHPHGFASAVEALAWMRDADNAARVQLALLDRAMAQMDGLELAGQLRARGWENPTILLTGAGERVESGALFAVSLAKPAGPDALAEALLRAHAGWPPVPSDAPAADSTMQLAGRRMLLVEDHPVNRMLLRCLLEKQGALLTEAEDGAQALRCIEEGARFDLILMDCQMPVMDGPSATRAIRQLESERHWPRTPILAQTAHAGAEEVAVCRESGMDGVVGKPCSNAQLYAAIAQLLEGLPLAATASVAAWSDSDTPLLDLAMLDSLEQAIGDDLRQVIELFCAALPAQIASLQHALGEDARADIDVFAHTLKGSAGNIGAVALASLARQLEQLSAQKQTLPAGMGAHLEQLASDTIQALRARCDRPPASDPIPQQGKTTRA